MKIKTNLFTRILSSGFTRSEVADMFGCHVDNVMRKQTRGQWTPAEVEKFVYNYRRKTGVQVDVIGVVEP